MHYLPAPRGKGYQYGNYTMETVGCKNRSDNGRPAAGGAIQSGAEGRVICETKRIGATTFSPR